MLQWIIASGLRLRYLVVTVAFVLIGIGTVELRNEQLEIIPEFVPLTLTVKTESLGLSSAEVESLITVPLEADLLNGVPWLQVIRSESMSGLSTIEMTFAPGTDLMQARQMVQERLTQAHALPNVSSPPVMLQPVSSASRIMNVGLSSKTVSPIEMSVQARWNIMPRLVGVAGVANVSIWGQRERQVQVQVDPRNLHAKGIKLEQVVKTAGEAVWSSPLTFLSSSTPGTGGFIDTPNQRLNIRHQLPITTAQDFAKVPVKGGKFKLGDVAYVLENHQPLIGDAVLKDGPGLLLVIEKFPGFSTSEVTRGIERTLDELRPGLPGFEIDTAIYRPAGFIELATINLGRGALFAVGLLVVSLGLLMASWRAALIAALVVPLSFIVATLVLHAFGIALNMMVIAGLMLAIGALVHDGVLDADAILHRLRQPREGRNAAAVVISAAMETRRSMFYATLIILLAVFPALFLHGRSAAFYEPLVWSYAAAVISSMVVALVVTPALGLLLLARAPLRPDGTSVVTRKLASLCESGIGAAARAPLVGIGMGIVAVVASVIIWGRLERDLLPSFKETDVVINWQGPPGTSLQSMVKSTQMLIHDLRQIPGVRNAAANLGRAVLCTCNDLADVNAAQVWVSVDPKANYDKTMDALEELATSYPGMRGRVESYLSRKMREALTGDKDTITVRVYGHSLDTLRAKAEEIRALFDKIPGIETASVELQIEEPSIEVTVDVDRAASYGLKPGDVRRATSAIVGGITVGALFQEQKVFDVVVWGRPEMRENISDVQNLLIDTDDGPQVRLRDLADVRTVPATSIIRRQGSSRRIDVSAEVGDRPVADVAGDIGRQVRNVTFPFEYRAEVLGEYEERRSALRSIYSYSAAAAVLIFLLAQAALGSWTLAALSLIGAPIVVLGALIAAAISGGALSLGSLLGMVTVLGLTVRQGIGLVSHFQALERDGGLPFGERLVLLGVGERFGSIVTTAITVMLVALPFAVLGDIAGLEIVWPIAVVILGGAVASTLNTLFVIPALYLRFGAGSGFDHLGLETKEVQ